MQIEGTSLKRRSLLQRCLAVLAGGGAVAAGVVGIGSVKGRGVLRASENPVDTLTLYGRQRSSPDKAMTVGELMDRPDGKVIGSFYTSCFCMSAPFGAQPEGTPSLELQVLQLADGTLFGFGGGARAEQGVTARALVGGTARYAGASGSYVERSASGRSHSHEIIEFVVTFAS